jgi:hydroxypyruvate reductase
MEDLKQVTRALLASGRADPGHEHRAQAPLAHPGRELAAATAARVLALVISDVTGDDPTHIASGPCAPDPSTYAEALEILARFGVDPPASIAPTSRRASRSASTRRPSRATASSRASRTASSPRRRASLAAGAAISFAPRHRAPDAGRQRHGRIDARWRRCIAALAREVRATRSP